LFWHNSIQRVTITFISAEFRIPAKERFKLRAALYLRDGKTCHYCGIPETDFRRIWAGPFYGGFKRGQRLEIDRKRNAIGYEIDNCVLACAICNMAKSDKFSYEEFQKVGLVIREIWETRKKQ